MNWFKHISTSHDDADIGEAILIFGVNGYYVFFRTLEVMSEEFSTDTPAYNCFCLDFFRKKFQISWKKTVKILKFFRQRKRIFFAISKGSLSPQIEIYCPKLEVLCDEYTKKTLRNVRTKSRKNPVQEAEKETEEEKDILKKPEPFRLPTPEEIENFTKPKVEKTINAICKELYERDLFPKANAFANKAKQSNANARAILHTLCRVFKAKPSQPWGYALKILKVEDGNFCEKDFRKTA